MTVNEIRHLFVYTEWANRLVLDAAENLSPEQLVRDVGISHKSIFETLLHTAGADWIWLERWHGRTVTGPEAWSQWTIQACESLEKLRPKWRAIEEDRLRYLTAISDADLPRELTFKRLNGEAGSLPLEQQMLHVVNHATLHRGQVVGTIRQLGIAPPATDLLFYLMEKQKHAANA
jgi:uncharacterized damage-inducible protein DinB